MRLLHRTETTFLYVNVLTLIFVVVMEEKRYVWKQRSAEWMAANPGKASMYREEVLVGDSSVDAVNQVEVPPDSVPKVKKESGKDAGLYVVRYGDWHYVGCSKNVPVRLRNHKMSIKKGLATDLNSGRFAVDVQKFGVQSFTFIFERKMPFATDQELLSAKAKLMLSILKSGGKLYNRDVPASVLNEVNSVNTEED